MRQYNYKCVVNKNGIKMYYKRINNKWKRISNKIGMKAEKGKKKYRQSCIEEKNICTNTDFPCIVKISDFTDNWKCCKKKANSQVIINECTELSVRHPPIKSVISKARNIKIQKIINNNENQIQLIKKQISNITNKINTEKEIKKISKLKELEKNFEEKIIKLEENNKKLKKENENLKLEISEEKKLIGEKIPVLLFGERHRDIDCAKWIYNEMKNIPELEYNLNPKLRKIPKLLVTEGRGKNECYQALEKSGKDSLTYYIIEHGNEQVDIEMLDKFLLVQPIFLDLSIGNMMKDPNGNNMDHEWLKNYGGKNDGYIKLIKKISNGKKLHNNLLNNVKDKDNYNYNLTLNLIYKGLIDYFKKSKQIELKKIVEFILLKGTTNKNLNLINEYLRELRDKDIILRVENMIKKYPNIKIVVIIFGALHYNSLISLINESNSLFLHKNSKNNIDISSHLVKSEDKDKLSNWLWLKKFFTEAKQRNKDRI